PSYLRFPHRRTPPQTSSRVARCTRGARESAFLGLVRCSRWRLGRRSRFELGGNANFLHVESDEPCGLLLGHSVRGVSVLKHGRAPFVRLFCFSGPALRE